MLTFSDDANQPGGFVLHAECVLPRPLDEVFDFFSKAENLEKLTPPWMHFKIITPTPVEMRVGTIIDYRIKVRYMPLKWRSEITVWEPGVRFVDEQRRGPYRYWRHEHRFAEVDGGTQVVDHIEYGVPGGSLVHRTMVRPDLVKIFAYRETQQRKLLVGDDAS